MDENKLGLRQEFHHHRREDIPDGERHVRLIRSGQLLAESWFISQKLQANFRWAAAASAPPLTLMQTLTAQLSRCQWVTLVFHRAAGLIQSERSELDSKVQSLFQTSAIGEWREPKKVGKTLAIEVRNDKCGAFLESNAALPAGVTAIELRSYDYELLFSLSEENHAQGWVRIRTVPMNDLEDIIRDVLERFVPSAGELADSTTVADHLIGWAGHWEGVADETYSPL